jgi:hypothetical protein
LFQGKRQRFAEIAKIAGKKDHRPQLQVWLKKYDEMVSKQTKNWLLLKSEPTVHDWKTAARLHLQLAILKYRQNEEFFR